jgi:hypothetical protein
MKYALLFIAILAATTGNLSGSPNQRPTSHEQSIAQQTPANPSPVTVVIDNGQRSEPASTATPKSPSGNTSAEWALVVVGIATAIVVGWQSFETRKAAQAALLNAQAVINAERPWVMVQIKEDQVERGEGVFDMRSFQFTIFNYGKSPAHVITCKGPKIEFHDDPDKGLPIQPDYGTWDWERRFLAPRDSLPIGKTIYPSKMRMETHSAAIAKGEPVKEELVVYGLIEYTDGVSGKSYRTAFCYRHEKMPPSSMGGRMVICGPSVYNEYI